jgi:hypothetical protein
MENHQMIIMETRVDGSVISFLPLAKDDADSLGPVYWYYKANMPPLPS